MSRLLHNTCVKAVDMKSKGCAEHGPFSRAINFVSLRLSISPRYTQLFTSPVRTVVRNSFKPFSSVNLSLSPLSTPLIIATTIYINTLLGKARS
jgi:hypothetical protein